MSQAERNAIIGQKVRFYRTAKNISMEKLCDMLPTKITHQQLARYETDQSRWPADLLCEIALALNVETELLLGIGKDAKRWLHPDEPEAERHKMLLLELPERGRKIIYQVITGLHQFDEEQKGKKA